MPYGTLTTLDTLASSLSTIAVIGEDQAFAAIDAALSAHNALMNDMISSFAEQTTDRMRRFGGDASMQMDEIDEYGRADAQKIAAGQNVAFPLKLFGGTLQWTRKYFQNATGAELAAQVTGMMTADVRNFNYQLKLALFNPTNYTTTDRLTDHLSLDVKRLANADGAQLPLGPNGETFDGSSHTHYLGTSSFAASDLTSLINTLVEHFATGSVEVYINSAQEATVRGFTGFTPYVDARLVNQSNAIVATAPLNVMNMNNRAIGIFGAAEVFVKPWVPSGYVAGVVKGVTPPLVYRTRNAASAGLQLVADNEQYPLRARSWEREFGLGAWDRVAAAVLYTGNATYAAPTLTR